MSNQICDGDFGGIHREVSGLVNITTGSNVTITGLASLISEAVGYHGKIVQDLSKPDGTPVKRIDY